ncbi:ABC transporter substrate-binding protein [Curtanaerobium respiraculi]|uniref:ABC transporter substrate-binding protein n=1 Tax=Curtanaerobium respiraculi TaxID=2949669 RepID=UPI0024B3B88D|nr:ABC transporter substrate-binding protein [Curtanaerobium respiraculi]
MRFGKLREGARIRRAAIPFVFACALILGCAVAAGCSSQAETNRSSGGRANETAAQNDAFPTTITDAGGRSVTIQEQPESILTVYGLKYVLALGLGDKVVNQSKGAFELAVAPNMADGVPFGKDQMNAETIAQLEPDIFIHKAHADEMYDALDKLGIAGLGIQMETPDEVVATTELLGKALGVEDRADMLCDYYENLMGKGADLTKGIPDNQRPTAILMGNTIGKVANGSMLQSIMIEKAGGNNLAKDIESKETWPTVGTEQIFEWNPDYIFIMNSTARDYDAQSLLEDPAWQNIKAVQNGNVYVVPSDIDSWEYPSLESALGTLWMTHIMFPDKLGDAEFEAAVDDFYQTVYNVSFTREQLNY